MNESNERWDVDINRQTPNLNSILAMQVSRHRAKKQLFYVGRVEGGYTRKQRYRYTPVKNSIYCDFQTCIFFPLRTIENKKNKKLSSKNKQMINFDENTKEFKIYNIYTYYMTFMVYVQKIFMYHS